MLLSTKIAFPNLYNNCYCGFSLPPGWKDLVWKLSEKLEMFAQVTNLGAIQVKEKFGGLRFHIQGNTGQIIAGLIAEAEKESFKICEQCGKAGTLKGQSWLKTLCNKCAIDPPGTSF